MPAILEAAVKKIQAKSIPKKNAWAIATASLQRSGALKKGTNKATPKGKKRGLMSPKQRASTLKGKRK